MSSKECTQCHEVKPLTEYYTKKRVTKKRGTIIEHIAECKACAIKRSAKWIKNNPEKFEVHWRNYNASDRAKQNNRNSRMANREREREYHREWRQKNPEQARLHVENRKRRLSQLQNDFTFDQWMECLDYFEHSCAYCGVESDKLQQDHFVPVCKDGGTTLTNIVPACVSCNSSKHAHDFQEWYRRYEFASPEREERIYAYFSHVLIRKNTAV